MVRFLLVSTLLLLPQPAAADDEDEGGNGRCEFLDAKLLEKQAVFKKYWEKNEVRKQDLSTLELGCRNNGAALSEKVAKLSLSLSCTAELDASGMDKDLHDLGADCTAHFHELKTLQIEMLAVYKVVEDDLVAGREFASHSELLMEDCANELQITDKLISNYHDLFSDMTSVQAHAEKGRLDYQHFAVTAHSLTIATRSRGDHCGADPGASLAAASGGKGPSIPSGESENPASTITGVPNLKNLESLGAAESMSKPGATGGATAAATVVTVANSGTTSPGKAAPGISANAAGAVSSANVASKLTTSSRGSPFPSSQGDSAILSSLAPKLLVPQDFDKSASVGSASAGAASAGAALWQEGRGELELAVASAPATGLDSSAGEQAATSSAQESASLFERVTKRYHQSPLFLEAAGSRLVSN